MTCGFTGSRRHSRWADMMGWRPFATSGELRLALLVLIREEAATGLRLMQKLEERAGGYYRAHAQTIYPLLQQLEDEGLAAVELQEGRRVYRITETGLQELARRAAEVEDLWRGRRGPREWYRDLDAAAGEVRDATERLVRGVRRTLSDEMSTARLTRLREILGRAMRDLDNEFRNSR
ncbi:MAG TPA: PadR family transcriptional regulator [Candidatus Binataceae bacterium]|nr:PadR family transcriptional regulator [Candidatus Binataceae bacterium]